MRFYDDAEWRKEMQSLCTYFTLQSLWRDIPDSRPYDFYIIYICCLPYYVLYMRVEDFQFKICSWGNWQTETSASSGVSWSWVQNNRQFWETHVNSIDGIRSHGLVRRGRKSLRSTVLSTVIWITETEVRLQRFVSSSRSTAQSENLPPDHGAPFPVCFRTYRIEYFY
jgi:hypothetical protein